jgi:hypothetical protein
MSAELVDLSITQGSSFSIRLEIRNNDGTAEDLTGYGVRGYLKNKYTDTTPLLDLSPVISDATGGQVDINVSASVTAALPITQGIYDIEKYLLSDATVVSKIIVGKILINPEVTTEV